MLELLDLCCTAASDRRQRRALSLVRENVHRAMTLSEAMKETGGYFPDFLVYMAAAGEGGGQLELLLEKLGDHYSREEELRGKAAAAMTYPVILFIVTILSAVFLLTAVVPQFASMLREQELPELTRFILGLSSGLREHGGLYLGAAAGLFLIIAGCMRISSVRMVRDRLLLHLPLAGTLAVRISVSQFASACAVLYGAGLGMLEVMEAAGNVLSNTYIRHKLAQAREGLKRGETLSQALSSTKVFPPVFISMAAAGEESGSLKKVLEQSGIYYEKEAVRAVDQIIALIEPVMILIMALLVGSIVMAVMLPIFTMYSSML